MGEEEGMSIVYIELLVKYCQFGVSSVNHSDSVIDELHHKQTYLRGLRPVAYCAVYIY